MQNDFALPKLNSSPCADSQAAQMLCTKAARCTSKVAAHVSRLCVQPLSIRFLRSTAPVVAKGEATMHSGLPLSVRHHVTMVLPALDIDAAIKLKRGGAWKCWTWSSPSKAFLSAQAFV